jgi:membrane protein DedA with SNARE-associated domain
MTDTIHLLVERYGLIAIFAGCIAEGESIALLAGFFAHQQVLQPWAAFAATFLGAFVGDVFFFLAGRRLAGRPFVEKIKHRPGFSHALQLANAYPKSFVILNRYAYGLRLVGAVATGFTKLNWATFIALNAVSSLIWSALFFGIGYVFGLGAEQVIGAELAKHERLLIGLGFGLAVAIIAGLIAHRVAGRETRD